MINKNPYKAICDFMFDENDNLPNSKDFFDAAKDLISQKPIVIKGIKFNHKDVEEIERAFNNAR